MTESPTELRAALEEAEAELHAAYRKVWPLREAYAETFPPAELPRPSRRTDKQNLVARCPRCSGRLHPFTWTKVFASSEEMTAWLEWYAKSEQPPE